MQYESEFFQVKKSFKTDPILTPILSITVHHPYLTFEISLGKTEIPLICHSKFQLNNINGTYSKRILFNIAI